MNPLTKEDTKAPEEVRERWRTAAKGSTYFMAKAVVGMRDLTPTLHRMMADWIQKPSIRKLGLAPRGHLKTSIWTVADSLREVANDPDIRILLVSDTIENSSAMLWQIADIVERNEIFRWLFPEILPEDHGRWNQARLEFKRKAFHKESTIEAISVGAGAVSRHYNLIKEDDLVTKKAMESKLEMDKAIDQHKLSESLLNAPADRIQCYGTRWHIFDLARWIKENQPNYEFLRLSVFKKDGSTIWPERFTKEHLAMLRQQYGPALFALQYENRAIGTGISETDLGWLRYYTIHQDPKGEIFLTLERPPHEGGPYNVPLASTTRFQLIDAGLSPESTDARTANVVLALTPPKGERPADVVLLEAQARKSAPRETISDAYQVYQRWNPVFASIEVYAGHVTFYWWIQSAYPDMAIRRLKTDSRTSKLTRIRSFLPFVEAGRFYVHRRQVDWMEEFEAFPNGRTVDLIDATAYGPQVWFPPEPEDPSMVDGEDWDYEALAEGEEEGRDPITGY